MLRAVGWALFVIAAWGYLVPLAFLVGPPQAPDVFWPVAWLGFPVVGAAILHRRPRHLIGRLLVGIGAAIPLSVAGGDVAMLVHEANRSPAFWEAVLLWLGSWTYVLGLGLVPFLVLYFPDGRTLAPGWSKLVRAAAVVLAALTIYYMFRPVPVDPMLADPLNPLGIEALAVLVGGPLDRGLILALVGFGLAALVHSALRFRRGSAQIRQQLKAFVAAAVIFPVLFGAALIMGEESTASDWVVIGAFVLSLNGMAAGIGIAIFRYRLYEIDRIISRTVTYGLVAGVLAAVYAGGVFLVQQVIGAEGDLAVAGSTLAAFALFSPLRRWVQRGVDRRFNRSRYDAARVVEGLASKLRDRVELEVVTAELVGAARSALQPATVAVWVREER